jgi:hypothetical protein
MSHGESDVDFVRLVPEDGAPPDEQSVASAFDADDPSSGDESSGGGLGTDEDDPFEQMGLDFVELYADNFQHFGKLAAILDPENPDELIDKAFLEVARRSDPPTSRGVALLEVRDALVRQRRNRFLRPRREIVELPDADDPVLDKLDELPDFQRDCLVLHHYAAMTPVEIAAVWRTSVESVDDNLDFAEAAFDATSDASAGDVGDRIRRSINAALVGFTAESDVEEFERLLKRRSRKPALLALAGVAAAALLIVVVALWRADPTGDAVIGPDRNPQSTSTTEKTTASTKVPSVITLPPKPGGSTATTSGGTRRSTGTTRRGTSGGGGGNNNGGGGGNNGGGSGTTRPPDTQPQPPPSNPTTTTQAPTTTTQPPAFSAARSATPQCSVGTAVYSYAGRAAPGATITLSSSYGSGSATAGADGNWSGSIALAGWPNALFQSIPISISSSQGGSASDAANITLNGLACS